MSRHRTASTAAHRTATLVTFAPRTIPASIPLNDVSELWAVRDAAEREQNKAGESPPDRRTACENPSLDRKQPIPSQQA